MPGMVPAAHLHPLATQARLTSSAGTATSRSAAGSTAAAAAREAVAKRRRVWNPMFIVGGGEGGKFWVHISFHDLVGVCSVHLQCSTVNVWAGTEELDWKSSLTD